MIKEKMSPLINLFIRAFTLLGKFILLFFMAKFLTLAEVGIYGLLVVLVSYSLYAVGFDFYTHSTREIISLKKEEWGGVIKKQGQLILGAYIIILPIIIICSSFFISSEWLIFLAILIFLEHFNQEVMRLLIVDNKAVLANNLLFIRSGLWCYVVILLIFNHTIEANLENILLFWVVFNSIALVIGAFYFFQDVSFKSSKKISNQWLANGLKICLPLLFSTLIVRAITTIDRIWLEKLEGVEVVAVYALFVGLTNSLISFLETGVFSFIYPKLISEKNNSQIFKRLVKKMSVQAIVLIVMISGALVIFLPFLLKWVNKEVYFEYYNVFYVVLIANIFYCLSMIPHYILYAKNQDSKIVISHILSLFVFVISTLIVMYNQMPVAVAYGLVYTFVFMFLIKSFFSLKEIR